MARVQLTGTVDRTQSQSSIFCRSPAPNPHQVKFWDISILASASIHFQEPLMPTKLTSELTSEGDICYGASAISGLNLHIPTSET